MSSERLQDHLDQAEWVTLCGLRLLNVDEKSCVQLVMKACDEGQGGWLLTPNLDILRQVVVDPEIRQLCEGADVVVADGMPLIWASHLQGTPLAERVTGSNLIGHICGACAERGRKVFLLGGVPGAADGAAEALIDRNPGLDIVGRYCPPFGFEGDETEIERMVAAIRDSEADVIFVALGFPKTERLIQRIRHARPEGWWIGVGISFSFLSGHVSRAPEWMQNSGLEWLHRLVQEPRRLARRYLVDDLPFAGKLFGVALANRIRRTHN